MTAIQQSQQMKAQAAVIRTEVWAIDRDPIEKGWYHTKCGKTFARYDGKGDQTYLTHPCPAITPQPLLFPEWYQVHARVYAHLQTLEWDGRTR